MARLPEDQLLIRTLEKLRLDAYLTAAEYLRTAYDQQPLEVFESAYEDLGDRIRARVKEVIAALREGRI